VSRLVEIDPWIFDRRDAPLTPSRAGRPPPNWGEAVVSHFDSVTRPGSLASSRRRSRRLDQGPSRWTVSIANAGRQIATYSAPSGSGVL
jgi:hypothetical protein